MWAYYSASSIPISGETPRHLDLVVIFAIGCNILIAAYGLYPLMLNSEKYFKRRDYEGVVIEFGFVKKLLFIAIPIPVILTIINQLQSPDSSVYPFIFAIWASSITVVTGALIRIASQIAKKEFRFYLAKGYCTIVSKKEKDIDKMRYLFLALDSYNTYLQQKLKFRIKSINKIYSDLIQVDANKKNEIMKSLCECLDADRLMLAKYLSTLYKVPETEQLFVKESLKQKLTTIGTFLAAAIPIVISIIQLSLSQPPK